MSRRAAWLQHAAVLGGALLPLLPALLGGRTLLWRDGAQLYAPLRPAVVEALRAFRLPLWNPWEGAGQPLLAQGIHAVLHPVSLLVAPFTASLEPVIVLLVLAAASGAAFAARSLGASRPAAAGAAFAYGLSGYVLSMAANLPFLAGAASLPWAVGGLRRAATGARHGVAVAALGTAALALAGDAGSLAAGLLLGGALAVEAGGARGALRALGGASLGLALAAIQLAPSWAWLRETARGVGALPPSDLTTWALVPSRLLELVAPGFLVGVPRSYSAPVFAALDGGGRGFPFAASVFVGAPAIVLAAAGARASRPARVALAGAALFAWLALGHRAGAQQLLAGVPVWGALRYWEKMVGPLTLCLALAAGAGVDALGENGLRRRVALAAAGAAFLGAALGASAPALAREILGGTGPVVELAGAQLRGGLAHGTATVVLLAVVAWRAPAVARAAAFALLLLASAAAASPFALHAGDPAVLRLGPPPLAAAPPGPRLVSPLGFDFTEGDGRLDAVDRLQAWEARTGRPATNAAASVDSIVAYTGVASLRYELLLASGPSFWPLVRRFGTTHVVARAPATGPEEAALAEATRGGVPVAVPSDPEVLAWAIPHRPWAGFVPAALQVDGPLAAARAVADAAAAGAGAIVVEAPGPFATAPGRVLAISRDRERVDLEAESAGDALLVVNDAWAPGWRGEIDGAPAEVLPADLLVRAVRWPAGRHRLVMRYEAPGLATGAAVSAAAALVLAALVAAGRAPIARRSHAE